MGRPSDSRERILESAAKLWHCKSYDGVGVAEICQDAGVLKGSFYHFFASKEELVLAVLDEHWRELSEQILQPTLDPQFPALERIRRLLAGMGVAVKQQHASAEGVRGCPIGNLVSELGTRDEALRRRVAEIFDETEAMLRLTLQDAVRLGEIPPDTDLDLAAASLVTYLQGLAVIGKTYNDPARLEKLAEQALLLAGLSQAAG